MTPTLTILNQYVLKGSAAQFTVAISALTARVEHEGEHGVLSYRFFVNGPAQSAIAIIDYATPQAWIGHHDRSMAWQEMQALHRVATLAEVTFLGPLTDEIRLWLASSGLKAQVNSGYSLAAGFRRT